MKLILDSTADSPIHKQIAARVRKAITEGELDPGTRLPTARELAEDLEVNVNTVLRGYRELAAEDLVDMRRGRGTVVREIPDLARLYHLADQLLDEAARLGITRGELAGLLVSRS